MLILHGSLHILVAHGPHDGSQLSRSLQNPGAVIMPPTIEDKIFGKPSFDPGFAKSLRHCGEVSRLGTGSVGKPILRAFLCTLLKNVKDTIAHRHASPSLFGLAVRHEDHAGFTAYSSPVIHRQLREPHHWPEPGHGEQTRDRSIGEDQTHVTHVTSNPVRTWPPCLSANTPPRSSMVTLPTSCGFAARRELTEPGRRGSSFTLLTSVSQFCVRTRRPPNPTEPQSNIGRMG